jgi:hypothetical protein
MKQRLLFIAYLTVVVAVAPVSSKTQLEVVHLSAGIVYVNGGTAMGLDVGDSLFVGQRNGPLLVVAHVSSYKSACARAVENTLVRIGDPVFPVRQDLSAPPEPQSSIDVHRGQFAQHASQGRCEACHSQASFIPSTYTIDDHNKSRFPLEGAHLALPCRECHKFTESASGSYQQFVFEDIRCAACHGASIRTRE